MIKTIRTPLTLIALAVTSSTAFAHGYVSELRDGVASGRAGLCKHPVSETGEKNMNCGAIQYEPQSVEGPEGFPEKGPEDGKIASAGNSLALALDEQTADRWVKRPIEAGVQTFEWTLTANHITRDWKYYMTKADWNPNEKLSRNSFDLTPFCEIAGNMVQPPKETSHECNVPEREGYHVILAVWDVGDTAASFYNVIDVDFDSDMPSVPDWNQSGQITPTMDLNIGDLVYTRVFDESGENAQYRTELAISDALQGQAKNWSYQLASKINEEETLIKAGQYSDGEFVPVYGTNPIYVREGSGLKRVEIGYDLESPAPDESLTIEGLQEQYILSDEPTELDLTLTAYGNMEVELTVYNHHNVSLASWKDSMKDGDVEPVVMTLSKSELGHHMLVASVKDTDGNLIEQETHHFFIVEGGYDYVFPDGLEHYTDGTTVLARDGNIYQCKNFPHSGYCVQWTSTATQYEPGIGSHWEMAWDKLN